MDHERGFQSMYQNIYAITLNKLSCSYLFLTVKFARELGSIDGALLQWEYFLIPKLKGRDSIAGKTSWR